MGTSAGGALGGVGGAGLGIALGSTTVVGAPIGGVAGNHQYRFIRFDLIFNQFNYFLLGGAAGASSGAAFGALVGNLIGRVLEARDNLVMDNKLVALQTTESPKWMPDDVSLLLFFSEASIVLIPSLPFPSLLVFS